MSKISKYGIKIKNIKAGMIYDVNIGVRDYFTYTEAMLNNSLFSYHLKKNGIKIYKKPKSDKESTRDIICLDFDFGSRSYEEEKKRLEKLENNATTIDDKNKIKYLLKEIGKKEKLYNGKNRDKIREDFYQNGVDISYRHTDKKTKKEVVETIHYLMLFRTSAKAKVGQVIFINENLYDDAYDWLTIGLGKKMSYDNAKIVEMSAYAPLTTSTIVGTLKIPVEDILILKDQDSFFSTFTSVVKAEEYIDSSGNKKKKCIVESEEREVKNTLWDGMGIIESSILPGWINGMALLRNHLFKMCGFKGHVQLFFKDWCKKNNHDYNTYQVEDMFGCKHYLKDIKIITTDNSIKWKKFIDIMGGTLSSAYEYWCDKIREDGNIWGVVKTDHQSKFENSQQLSYQMINTLPCTKEDVYDIASDTVKYIETLKTDNVEFEKFLRKYANEINHYQMLADLYRHNPDFANCGWFRNEKKKIIFEYVNRMRKGKILVNGDNLTVCGNPYALLLYSVGENWKEDPTFSKEENSIQCYTRRFSNDEYLCGFRNPHNSPNNVCHFHNVYSQEMSRYFDFSKNIMAVNCIGTDVQDRMNGEDFDSDFNLVTNNPVMVKYAEICYRDFPTIVNDLKESGITYKNTLLEYARMDNKFSKSRIGIGYSSNLAQLALTYYWTELQKDNPNEERLHELYDNFVILSVLAQVIIDGCKREYEIDGMKEIDRISKMPCMKLTKQVVDENGRIKSVKFDFPKFMKYTRAIKTTKNGKEIPQKEIHEKKVKLKNRINPSLVCPMNWLEECLDTIKPAANSHSTPISDFFIKMPGKPNNRQMTKIRSLIEEYDLFVKNLHITNDDDDIIIEEMISKSEKLLDSLCKIKVGNIVTINRMIEVALGLDKGIGNGSKTKNINLKYSRKILNYLHKMDKDKFLLNFKPKQI